MNISPFPLALPDAAWHTEAVSNETRLWIAASSDEQLIEIEALHDRARRSFYGSAAVDLYHSPSVAGRFLPHEEWMRKMKALTDVDEYIGWVMRNRFKYALKKKIEEREAKKAVRNFERQRKARLAA